MLQLSHGPFPDMGVRHMGETPAGEGQTLPRENKRISTLHGIRSTAKRSTGSSAVAIDKYNLSIMRVFHFRLNLTGTLGTQS